MDSSEDLSAGLRAKGYTVGDRYVQSGANGIPARHFIIVDDVSMPVDWAVDLNAGRVTLPEIVQRLKG